MRFFCNIYFANLHDRAFYKHRFISVHDDLRKSNNFVFMEYDQMLSSIVSISKSINEFVFVVKIILPPDIFIFSFLSKLTVLNLFPGAMH